VVAEDTEVQVWMDDALHDAYVIDRAQRHETQVAQADASFTPQFADRVGQLANLYSTLSPELIVGIALSDVPLDDARLIELARREEEDRQNVWDFVQPVLRGAFLGLEGVYEAGQGLIRSAYIAATKPDVSFAEAFIPNVIQGNDLIQAGAALASGERVNIGSGFLPESTLPQDRPEYAALVSQGYTQEEASMIIFNDTENFGKPITHIADQARHTFQLGSTVERNNFAENLRQQGASQQEIDGRSRQAFGISPGRILTRLGHDTGRTFGVEVFEPDAWETRFFSGMGDFASQIFLDPANALGAGLTKTRKLHRTFTNVASPTGLRASLTGQSDGFSFVKRLNVEDFVNSPDMDRLARGIIDGTDNTNYMKIRSFKGFKELEEQSPQTIRALNDATTVDEVRDIIRGVAGAELHQTPFSGQTSRMFGRMVNGDIGGVSGIRAGFRTVGPENMPPLLKRLQRAGQLVPGRWLNLDHTGTAMREIDEWMLAAGMSIERRGSTLRKMSKITDGDTDAFYSVVTDTFDDWAKQFDIEKVLKNGETVTKRPPEIQSLVNTLKEINQERHFATSGIGDAMPSPTSKIKFEAGDGLISIEAEPHLVAELLNRRIPLPDARQTRKALNQMNKLRSDFKLQAGLLEESADMFMSNAWIPMTLIRGAWTLRVVGEEAVRTAFTGLDSVFRHPVQAFLLRTSRRLDKTMTGESFDKDMLAARGALQVNSGYLGKYNPSQKGIDYFPVGRDSPDFMTAWGQQIRKAASSEDIQKAARMSEDEFMDYWLDGGGIFLREKLAKIADPDDADDVFRKNRLVNDRDTAERYGRGVYARLHSLTGGSYEAFDPVTKKVIQDADGVLSRQGVTQEMIDRVDYKIIDPGNPELIEAIGKGRLGEAKMGRRFDDKGVMQRRLDRELENYVDSAPSTVIHGKPIGAAEFNSKMNTIRNNAFYAFMGGPSGRFSRSPTYRQLYAKAQIRMAPFTASEDVPALREAFEAMSPTKTLRKEFDDALASAGGPSARARGDIRGDIHQRVEQFTRAPSAVGVPASFHGGTLEDGVVGLDETMKAASPFGLFGPGLYSTDAPSIANGYAGHMLGETFDTWALVDDVESLRGYQSFLDDPIQPGAPHVSKVEWTGKTPPRVLDLEGPVPAELIDELRPLGRSPRTVDDLKDEVHRVFGEGAVARIERDLDETVRLMKEGNYQWADNDALEEIAVSIDTIGDTAFGEPYLGVFGMTDARFLAEELLLDRLADSDVSAGVVYKLWQRMGFPGEGGSDLAGFGEEMAHALRVRGFDALSHKGGVLTGSPAHKVHIWLDTDKVTSTDVLGATSRITDDVPVHRLLDIGTRDRIAHANALTGTRDLLYDVSRRHEWSDVFRNFSPFAEAWWEILSTWAKIGVAERPIQALRRPQQIVTGGQDSGWFTEDPATGELMFNFPGEGILSSALGLEAGEGVRGRFTGAVSGLNLFSQSFFPGVGPTVQVPVAAVTPLVLNKGTGLEVLDFISPVVFPFGKPEVTSFGDVVDTAMPRWLQKVVTGVMGENTNNRERIRTWNNTVSDIYTAKQWAGDINIDPSMTPEEQWQEQTKWMGASKGSARWLWVIRGFTQFLAPTSPQFKLEAEDENGDWWFFRTLSNDYWRYYETVADGDHTQTTAWFEQQYGLDPTLLRTAKSSQLRFRSTTEEGFGWELQNQDLFAEDAFPLTGSYAAPNPSDPDEFDWNAYTNSLREGTRIPRTPDEWLRASNHALASLQYKRVAMVLDEQELLDTPQGEQYLQGVREWLKDQYEGYLEQPFLPERSFENKLKELERWGDDPRLGESPAGQAVSIYLEARTQALQLAADRDNVKTLNGKKVTDIRAWLREVGTWLVSQEQYRGFDIVWQNALKGEVNDN